MRPCGLASGTIPCFRGRGGGGGGGYENMVLRGEGASKEYRILMVIETTVSNDKRNSTNNVKCKPFFSLPFVGVCVRV